MTFQTYEEAVAWAKKQKLDKRDGFIFALVKDGWIVIQEVLGTTPKRPEDL